MTSVRIIIFAKAPLPGVAKTRLIPALGEHGAAQLAQRMLHHTVTTALAAGLGDVELCVTPDPSAPLWQPFRNLESRVHWQTQGEGELGERLARAARRSMAEAEESPVLLIGTDCPTLSDNHLREAAVQIQSHDAVMIPSADGGYVLLGLKRFNAAIFQGIAWSTDSVAFATLCRIGSLGWSVAQLPMLRDIDEPKDLAALPPGWLKP